MEIFLSNSKIDGEEGQCDCACPTNVVSSDSISLFSSLGNVLTTQFQKARELALIRLNDEFQVGFNPLGPISQAAVLNNEAVEFLEWFAKPTFLYDLPDRIREPPSFLENCHRLVLAGLLEIDGYSSAQRHPDTLVAWLHLTNACNLNCPYCYVRKTKDHMPPEVGERAVTAVIESAVRHGYESVKFKYAGGEASLNREGLKHIHGFADKLAKKRGVRIGSVILSNGVSLSERFLHWLKENDIKVMISLDGVGEAHDVQRPLVNGRGSFYLVARTLVNMQRIGLVPDISITLTDRNVENLPQLVDYVLGLGMPFSINFYRENDCSADVVDLRLAEDRVITYMQQAYKVIEKNLPPWSLLASLVDRANLAAYHERTCGVGDSYVAIDHMGRIFKCQMDMKHSLGLIDEADILLRVRDDYSGIRNVSVDEKEGCRSCEWRYRCAGGCPLATFRTTGRYDIKSPNCRIYKALYPEVVRLEGLRILKYENRHC